jgi:cobalt-zinc-cadmium efflux system protein
LTGDQEKDVSHNHNHNHSHGTGNYTRAFAIGILLNVGFVIIEIGYGIFADSLALIADAGHNISDVVSLLLVWGASVLATKTTSDKRTYGFRKVTIMSSLVSAILLLVALGGITWEAIGRFQDPKPVEGITVIIVAAIGVLINTVTALLFIKAQEHDLNIRGAFLHMAADAGVSLGVVVAGIIIMIKGWLWVDPLVSMIIVAVIFYSTWYLLRDSMNYIMDAVPRGIDINKIREYLVNLEQVGSIHDLHVWPLSTSEVALTVHLVVNDHALNDELLSRIQHDLDKQFGIAHSTIQVESGDADNACMLDRPRCIQSE